MTDQTVVHNFIEESRQLGYDISGSVFKADYNGKEWSVGFWIRPADWHSGQQIYSLPGRCGKGKSRYFKRAIKIAMQDALKQEEESKECQARRPMNQE